MHTVNYTEEFSLNISDDVYYLEAREVYSDYA